MERTLLEPNPVSPRTTESPDVAALYAVAAARMVVTSKRRFVTSCGAQRLTGEVMTIGYVQPSSSVSLEASIEGLIGDGLLGQTERDWSALQLVGPIFDPDVLLAWLLAEGVAGRH